MIEKDKRSKADRNYIVDMLALLPTLLVIFSGIVLLKYHSGSADAEKALNFTGYFWRDAHAFIGLIMVGIIGLHLAQHLNWFKTLFIKSERRRRWKRNLTLVVLFTLTVVTGLVQWLFMGDSDSAKLMLGVHNKFGLLMIIFVIIHLITYTDWLVGMTKKALTSKRGNHA